MKTFFYYLMILLVGALLTLAFAPFHIYSLSFILPAILLYWWLNATPKKSFFIGWIFGFGFFIASCSWIYISLHQFGNAPVWLAGAVTVLFMLILGLYFGLLGYVFKKFFARATLAAQCLFIFPVLWVVIEALRSTLVTGFPWVLLGYAQIDTPIRGLAPLMGVYGLSFVTAMMSGALVLLFTRQSRSLKITSLVLIFGWIGLGWAFSHHAWTKPIGKPLQVSLIQGDIPIDMKWNASSILKNINVYQTLTFQHWDSQLIVWPEGALSVYPQEAKSFISNLNQLAKKHHSNVLFGIPIFHENTKDYFNGLLLIGDNQGKYLKRHLVPFGEYIPMPSIFGKLMSYFQIPMSDFSKGPEKQAPLQIGSIQIAPFICYEIAFSNQVLRYAENSNLLLTISDDAWFGKSIALAQHLQMAQMRSLETGRAQLLDTNTGITAFISPLGEIIKGAPIGERVVITSDVQPMAGKTPLMRWRY